MRFSAVLFVFLLINGMTQAKVVNLRGYTAGGVLPAAQPSTEDQPLDVRAQLQAAIDEVAADGGGTVVIPGDTLAWFLSRPVYLDRANVTVRGELGARLCPIGQLRTGELTSTPLLLLGVPRSVDGYEITPSHRDTLTYDPERPELTLDASAGARFGLRTKGRNAADTADIYAHGYINGSLLAIGPLDPRYMGGFTNWGCPTDAQGKPDPSNYAITLDLAFKQNTPGILNGTICGVGMSNAITDRFTNWMLGTFPDDQDPHMVVFKFKTGDPHTGNAVVHALPLGRITDTNLHRVTIQLDVGSGQCAAWLDGAKTASLELGLVMHDDGSLNRTKELWRYEQGAFQLGALRNGALGDVLHDGLHPAQQHVDWTYGGFVLYSGRRYTWETTLQRVDREQITVGWRFFPPAYREVAAVLPLTDNPDTEQSARDGQLLEVQEGQDRGLAFGFWLPERTPIRDEDGALGLRNIRLESLSSFGPIMVGEVRELTLTGIEVRGNNVFAYNDLNCGVINGETLPLITDVDCSRHIYSPAHSAVYWANKDIRSTNFNVYASPGTTMRLLGCRGVIRFLFLTPAYGNYYLQSFAGARGGPLEILSPCLDNEGYVDVPGKAAFYHEFGPLGYGVTRDTNRLVLRNVFTGVIPSATPFLELPDSGEGTLLMENITCSPAGEPFMERLVLNKNPNAYGTVRSFIQPGEIWSNRTFVESTYPAGLQVFNPLDGYYYRSVVAHHPGDHYQVHPANGAVISDDNRPLADEAWQQFWERVTQMPDVWKTGQAYSPGDLVMAPSPRLYPYITVPELFRCVKAHTAATLTTPATGAEWPQYWASLQWREKTGFEEGAVVSADGAVYRSLLAHTTARANRPRPWEKIIMPATGTRNMLVQYAGPPGTFNRISIDNYVFNPVYPPVTGAALPGEVVHVRNPRIGQPTAYRYTLQEGAGVWLPEALLTPVE